MLHILSSYTTEKHQVICFSPFNSLGFNFHAHKLLVKNHRLWSNTKFGRGARVYIGFKIQCCSNRVINGETKRYSDGGGELYSILWSLSSEGEVEKTLDLYIGKLRAKEFTVILQKLSAWEKVVSVFEWMKAQEDYEPNVIHYSIVLRTLGRAQKWDEFRLLWTEMAQNGVSPTNHVYSILVDLYGKAGLVEEALLWVKHMSLNGIFPDEVTMGTVVNVLKDAGEYDPADKFYRDWCAGKINLLDDLELTSVDESEMIILKQLLLTELLRTGARNPSLVTDFSEAKSSNGKPELTATYNTLIDLYGKAGRLKDAADVFAEMLKSGVAMDTLTFNNMIFTCGNHGNFAEAEALLYKMEERGISPDAKTYNIFISMHANAGNIHLALEHYGKIRKVGLLPDDVTFRAILHILCKEKMVHEVEAVIKEIERLGMRVDEKSLLVVMELYISEGLTKRANSLLEKCQLIGGLSSKTYLAIMDAYANHGLWAEAEDLFFCKRDMFRQKKTVLEYNVMVKAYSKAKICDRALILFKGMKSQGILPDDCTYSYMIHMLSGRDLVDKAKKILYEMLDVGFKPSCLTFSAIIDSYAHSRRHSDAVEVFQEMRKAGVEPNEVVYGSLIDGFAEAGKFEEAMKYFHMMEESCISPNQIILTSMIKAYTKLGLVEGAQHVYEKLKILDTGPDIVASNSMLKLYSSLEMISEAKLLFRDLCQKGIADAFTFATMIRAYRKMGMLSDAIDVAEEMKHSGFPWCCMAFNEVMGCYCAIGQLIECGELLHEMVDQKVVPNSSTFKILFTILRKGGYPAEAIKQLKWSYIKRRDHVYQAVIISVFSVVGLHAFALESCETLLKTSKLRCLFLHNVLIYAYGTSGKIDEALNIFMRMQDVGLKPNMATYLHLVRCYGEAHLVQGIQRIYGQLRCGEIEHSTSLYNAVIDAYKDVGRFDLANLVREEMRLAESEDHYPNSGTDDDDETFSSEY